MSEALPRTTQRALLFENGTALGLSHRWDKGQYCSILTAAGIVGSGIYDLATPAESDQAIAVAKGSPGRPLAEPEDLFDARIVGVTPRAATLGIEVGMTGREAVERLLRAARQAELAAAAAAAGTVIRVKALAHATLVVKDLERSRQFYAGVLGMREVPRPAFPFAGLWFEAGDTQLHLLLEDAGTAPAGNFLPEYLRPTRTRHLTFAVDDAEAVAAKLRSSNVPLCSGVKTRPDGYLQVFIADPDGHVISLESPPRREE